MLGMLVILVTFGMLAFSAHPSSNQQTLHWPRPQPKCQQLSNPNPSARTRKFFCTSSTYPKVLTLAVCSILRTRERTASDFAFRADRPVSIRTLSTRLSQTLRGPSAASPPAARLSVTELHEFTLLHLTVGTQSFVFNYPNKRSRRRLPHPCDFASQLDLSTET